MGAEGEGLSQLTKSRCDRLVALPLKGRIESLNAAVSAAVIIYEAFKAKKLTLGLSRVALNKNLCISAKRIVF